jgi:hypothetical protein
MIHWEIQSDGGTVMKSLEDPQSEEMGRASLANWFYAMGEVMKWRAGQPRMPEQKGQEVAAVEPGKHVWLICREEDEDLG